MQYYTDPRLASALAERRGAQRLPILPPDGKRRLSPNIDDGMAGTRFEKLPAICFWRKDSKTPLCGEQKGEGANISIFVVAYVRQCGGLVLFWVVREIER